MEHLLRKLRVVWRPLLYIVAIGVVMLQLSAPILAEPIPIKDHTAVDGNWEHWTNQPLKRKCGGLTTSKAGPVYFLGDSIGTQVSGPIASALTTAGGGWIFQPNAVSGRTISGGIQPDGLTGVNQDQAFIKTATTIVIELGTNGGVNPGTSNTLIDTIRGLNPNANIFWVDTAVIVRQDYAQTLNGVNGTIYDQSIAKNYKVISWNKAVFGDSADPKNINANAPDNGYIRRADQYVHLTDAGITAMANLIATAITGSGSSNAPEAGSGEDCSCSTLSGANNKEKIWNFLIGKGLSPPQAAGIMGNMQAESHFDPSIDQGGPGGPVGEYNNAYGLVQWDGPRRVSLENAARAAGVDVADLEFQLNYMYNESVGREARDIPGLNEWDGLKREVTAEGAAFYWHRNFERSNDGPGRIKGRSDNAVALLLELGSASGPGGGSGCSANAAGIVQTAVLFSWPERSPESTSLIPKPEYAAALAKFNPGAPYAGADCAAFVGTVMRASGADPNFPPYATSAQEAYVRSHPELYDVVDSTSVADLKPGDILIVNQNGGSGANGHTLIYVGPQPPKNYSVASASGGDRMGNLGNPPEANGLVADDRGNYLRARLK